MDWLKPGANGLAAESVSLTEIAEQFGTPTFVYSKAAIVAAYREFAQAAAGRNVKILYAMKANSNLAVINLLLREGAGFDIVSGGELRRVLAAGGSANSVVFSGVGKTRAELKLALELGVACFNVESLSELRRLSAVASQMNKIAPISVRVNPDVDAGTHPYISTGLRQNKFGIGHHEVLAVYREAAQLPGISIAGIDCHLGSQITEIAPYLAALEKLLELIDGLAAAGIALRHLDLGGGLGIRYRDEVPPPREQLLHAIFNRIDRHALAAKMQLMFEFGRSIVGNGGLLLTRVEYLKSNGGKHFAIVDSAMNDLIRPAMYNAWHDVRPVQTRAQVAVSYDIVGPVCESGDWLARDRALAIEEGDLLAIASTGAYGMVMSSNYNSRGRAAEVIVDNDKVHLVRPRETVEELYHSERLLPSP